jgi:SAM-dependent methyltransferase
VPRSGLYDVPMDRWPMTAASANAGQTGPMTDPELDATLSAFANTDYRDKFWPSRRYEDACDRIALRAFLPTTGTRLLEVGAGFGRLASEYHAFREVVLLDPSDAMIGSAREKLAADPRFTCMSGVAQHLPFPDGSFDAVVCVRVVHHFADPRPAIAEFARVLRPGGTLILEAANRRNLKSILAWLMRRRSSPFGRGSQAYVDVSLAPRRVGDAPVRHRTSSEEAASTRPWTSSTSYLHAPADVRTWLANAGMVVARTRSVALLRPRIVTGHLPTRLIVGLEHLLQPGLAIVMPGPSMFVVAVRGPAQEDEGPALPGDGA